MRSSDNEPVPCKRRTEQGYILLTLLLGVALLVIAAAVVAPSIAFQIKRDREEELIHRGVQYTRAIRLYSKQTHGFPDRLEQLQDHAGRRYIRRLYKDPVTGRGFRPVYTSDIPNVGMAAGLASPGSGNGGSENSSDVAQSSAAGEELTPGTQRHAIGEIMFGVVSTSSRRTIREFNHKNRYNQWLFFYQPKYDQGLEIKGPTQFILAGTPPVQAGVSNNQQATQDSSQPQLPQQQ
jgi:type II secretory pathway pseudopilin PulG